MDKRGILVRCDAGEAVGGARIRVASYATTYDIYVVNMGFRVVLGLDFLRHAKPCRDFMTDEVHFRCPADMSHLRRHHRPPNTADSAHATSQHTPHIQQKTDTDERMEDIVQVTKEVYAE